MTLAIRKLGYSRCTWRIVLVHPEGHQQEIAHLYFDRKRDALPVLQALDALGLDWHQHDAWTEEERAAMWAIVQGTEGYQRWAALAYGPARAPR